MISYEAAIFAFIQSVLNVPYKWGGNNPLEGFDCSGLDICIAKAQGIEIPGDMRAAELYHYYLEKGGHAIPSPMFGARAFFGKDKDSITHVAFCLNRTHMVEAGGGNSTINTLEDAKKAGAFVRIRPIHVRKDRVALILPLSNG